jgi:uncharacterized protein YbjT (DUF2867 family)
VVVAIAGGHGKIALRLERILSKRGDRVLGLIRNPDHAGDLEDVGAEPVICDLEAEDDISGQLDGVEAVVFAAGAGPGSGAERKQTMDLGGAVKLIDGAKKQGIKRYLIVSSIGAGNPAGASEQMRPYIEAKAEADRAVAASGLEYTIVRPGGLTDDPGTGRVRITTREDVYGRVTRDDVAEVLAAALEAPNTIGKTFVLLEGDTKIDDALAAL